MDIVSLVIGTSGLVAFAQAAFDVTKTLRDVQSFPDDMTDLIFRLSVETAEVGCWASQAASLRTGQIEQSTLERRDQELVDRHKHIFQRCATEVQTILTQIDRITRKYIIVPRSEQGLPDLASSTDGAPAGVPRIPSYAFLDGSQLLATAMASPAVPNSSQAFEAQAWRMQTASVFRTFNTRKRIAAVLKPWGSSDKETLEEHLSKLAAWTDRVYSLLLRSDLNLIKNQLRTLLIRSFDGRGMLEGIGRATKEEDPEVSKSAALAIQVLDAADNPHCDCRKYQLQHSRLRMQDGDLGSYGTLEDQMTAFSGLQNAGPGVPVYVEWLNYSGFDKAHEQIALDRIHALCHILDTEKPNSLQTLRFLGYVQNHEDKQIGIISSVGDWNKHLVPLRQILDREHMTSENFYPRLTLGQRFSLALQLCKVFLELHTSRWLHRGFSSYCVLLQASSSVVHSDPAVVCGFQYARPAGKAQISLPLNYADFSQRIWYLHPDVRHDREEGFDTQRNRARYENRHDVFSLGIVLAEIGMGKPLEKIVKNPSSERFIEILRSLAKSNLPFHMGQRYADVVDYCLGGHGSPSLAPEDLVGRDLMAQSSQDNDNISELTVLLDQVVLSLENCQGTKL